MSRAAFTLIELLVATALVVAIVAVSTMAVAQMLTTTHRLQAIQGMDAIAATAQIRLGGEIAAIHPCAALWLTSDKGDKSVELLFMRSKYPRFDNVDLKAAPGCNTQMMTTDLTWSRWHWSAASNTLRVSENRRVRWTRISAGPARNYWNIVGGSKMPNDYLTGFIAIPQLRRDDTGDPVAALNANAWQSSETSDVGDYDDLILNSSPLLHNCTDFSVELQNLDGATRTASPTADLAWSAPGSFIDGRSQTGLEDRPGIVRVRFTLADPPPPEGTGVSCTYSFSFSTPAFSPY